MFSQGNTWSCALSCWDSGDIQLIVFQGEMLEKKKRTEEIFRDTKQNSAQETIHLLWLEYVVTHHQLEGLRKHKTKNYCSASLVRELTFMIATSNYIYNNNKINYCTCLLIKAEIWAQTQPESTLPTEMPRSSTFPTNRENYAVKKTKSTLTSSIQVLWKMPLSHQHYYFGGYGFCEAFLHILKKHFFLLLSIHWQ